MIFGGQDKAVIRKSFTGWWDELAELRVSNMIEKLKMENLKFKAKGDESMRRAMGMMFGGQASLLAKQSLSGWKDLLPPLRIERMKEELLKLKFKGDESMKRVLARMFGGQSNLLVQSVFAEWRDELGALRQERLMEKLKE